MKTKLGGESRDHQEPQKRLQCGPLHIPMPPDKYVLALQLPLHTPPCVFNSSLTPPLHHIKKARGVGAGNWSITTHSPTPTVEDKTAALGRRRRDEQLRPRDFLGSSWAEDVLRDASCPYLTLSLTQDYLNVYSSQRLEHSL